MRGTMREVGLAPLGVRWVVGDATRSRPRWLRVRQEKAPKEMIARPVNQIALCSNGASTGVSVKPAAVPACIAP